MMKLPKIGAAAQCSGFRNLPALDLGGYSGGTISLLLSIMYNLHNNSHRGFPRLTSQCQT